MPRPLPELQQAIAQASSINDVGALEQCAFELDEIGSAVSLALSARLRGTVDRLHSNNTQALEHYNRALAFHKELGDRREIAHDVNNIGAVYMSMGSYSEALEHYLSALALYEECGARRDVSIVLENIGAVYRETSNYPLALEHFHRALALFEEFGIRSGIANVTGNIGIVHFDTGNYPMALEHFHRAVADHKELGNRINVAHYTGNIGNVHATNGNYALALEHFHRAVDLLEELGDQSGATRVTANIGLTHFRMGDSAKALECYRRALDRHVELGNKNGVARITGYIVTTLIACGSFVEAEVLHATMENMQIDEPDIAIEHEHARASIQEHCGDIDDAVHILQSALTTAYEHSFPEAIADIHRHLRDICQKQNDFAGYIEHNNEYTRITEEINGRDTTLKLAMQEKQREIDAKEKEHAKHLSVLHSTLPKHIADRVARGETVNDQYDNAAVMFIDIVGFTTLSSTLTSQQVTTLLNAVFAICDEACAENEVTRVKTIGDSYLAVAFPSLVPRNDIARG